MQCPECKSSHINKNGHKKRKQNYICVNCDRQFIDCYETQRNYCEVVKREYLKMYVNGMRFRGIKRIKNVPTRTIINWVKQVGKLLPDYYDPQTITDVGELDELETFVGSKEQNLATAVDNFKQGILGWVLGDHSGETFAPLWQLVSQWQCYFDVTDRWKVYPNFIPDGDRVISKVYMTRVEGENTRLTHYFDRLHRQTLCYSKSEEMLRYSIQLLIHYLK
ncbi:IS1 family transposase [Aphanizomenon flos-aquae FACHB-1416]|uniref:IS1 family transposase n=2 Tax=Aphanizomenonaceae TaxID=1892259 RepID=A0ABR8ISA8_APHFL|nr:IS1 family transposase [Aphanizomenon flos-aquae FACHB-1171]MBD2557293.1 IS1 family transposase [Aphanizomenon flos-aquae FACHB-1290]MBD2631881.1 IS1 family transposase [Aphanizomenon sp. FACHB-1399]MBD2642745.1 IS1 family transposase [Aphanizomenon sp. FACHB-1401]MBD2657671.1 IS1 family transposase [Aphanizomenon flos-aquae FACHB-1265]MBD2673020.1 IS1 family transposase [Aphanizomenon flos-aquae FACHB-1416]MBD2685792.1 IS1 family transposase [Aphanizomenon flos-aquae FACHB-1249]MBD269735